MSKWLVTGGAGYIGRNLLDALVKKDIELRSLDLREKTHPYFNVQDFEHIIGNYGDKDVLNRVLKGVSGIIHLGAYKNPKESRVNENKYFKNNYIDSITLLNEARKREVSQFVFASSAAVYGKTHEKIHEQSPKNSNSPYGNLKYKFEEYIESMNQNEMKICSLRFFNVSGIGVNHNFTDASQGVVSRINECIRTGEIFEIHGQFHQTIDGTPVRDYVHINDVVLSIIQTMKKLESNHEIAKAINICSGTGTSILEIIATFSRLIKKEIKYKFSTKEDEQVSACVGDNSKAMEEIEWRPSLDLNDIVMSYLSEL